MEKQKKSSPKYRKGGKILSLDELARQECVYFYDKITHRSWFNNWQLGWVRAHLEFGHLYYAIRREGEDEQNPSG